jgi:hypothetical protein
MDLLYCEVISFDNVAYVVTLWHTLQHSSSIQGYIFLRSSSCGAHCVCNNILCEVVSRTIITHIVKIHVITALYESLYSTVDPRFVYLMALLLCGYCSVYVIPLILDCMPEWNSKSQCPGWAFYVAVAALLPIVDDPMFFVCTIRSWRERL